MKASIYIDIFVLFKNPMMIYALIIRQVVNFALLGFGILFSIAMLYAGIISVAEKESRAAKVSFLLSIIVLTLFLFLSIADFNNKEIISYTFLTIMVLSLIILFFPRGKKIDNFRQVPVKNNDERDIMFSRDELIPGTELFNEYYLNKRYNKELDDKFRERPGLLSPDSIFFHPYSFASSHANLEIIEALKPYVNGKIGSEKVTVDPQKITRYIKSWAKRIGTHSVGITELKDYHLYSHKGRGSLYGKEIENKHPFAIAITTEMAQDMVQSAPYGSIVMESTQQYLKIGVIALQIASFIRNLGYSARAHIDGNYEVICPLVARDAGLGEIGRMGLLMTPKLGPRVRIAVVTADIPLKTDQEKNLSSMIDFCTICKKCAESCPSNSISFDKRKEIDGALRWKINSESCFTYWCTVGTDCGRCMAVCPYSHPSNLMHNFIRWGIKNSFVFRRFALFMDNLFYGQKPKARKLPSWIDI